MLQAYGIKGSHIVNIANECEWTISELAKEIKEISKSDSKLTYIDAPKKRYDYEVERRVGSSEKLLKLTGYKPETSLNDGLQKIYDINYPKKIKLRDKELFELIDEEKQRQTTGIELIASENYASPEVMSAMGSILTNKYAEGLPGKRYYGGCEVVDKIEQLAIDRLCKLFNATWANVQPHSGAQANSAVFLACLNPGDKILGFDLFHGGHLTHGSPVNFSGKLYEAHFYGVEKETGRIDYELLEKVAKKGTSQNDYMWCFCILQRLGL